MILGLIHKLELGNNYVANFNEVQLAQMYSLHYFVYDQHYTVKKIE